MVQCSVGFCGRSSKTSSVAKDGTTFHRFPQDPHIKEAWVKMCGRINWSPVASGAVCSHHFDEKCFKTKKNNIQRRRLRRSAVPTLNLPLFLRADTENYSEETHHNRVLKLNPDVVPHVFEAQKDQANKTCDPLENTQTDKIKLKRKKSSRSVDGLKKSKQVEPPQFYTSGQENGVPPENNENYPDNMNSHCSNSNMYDRVCRICGHHSTLSRQLSSMWQSALSDDWVAIADDIYALTGVLALESDGGPSVVCIACCGRLRGAGGLVRDARDSDRLFRGQRGLQPHHWPRPIQVEKLSLPNLELDVKCEPPWNDEPPPWEGEPPQLQIDSWDVKAEPEEIQQPDGYYDVPISPQTSLTNNEESPSRIYKHINIFTKSLSNSDNTPNKKLTTNSNNKPTDITDFRVISYSKSSRNEPKSSNNGKIRPRIVPVSSQKLLASPHIVPTSPSNVPNSSQNKPTSSENILASPSNVLTCSENIPASPDIQPTHSLNKPASPENTSISPTNIPSSSQNTPNSSQNIPNSLTNKPTSPTNIPSSPKYTSSSPESPKDLHKDVNGLAQASPPPSFLVETFSQHIEMFDEKIQKVYIPSDVGNSRRCPKIIDVSSITCGKVNEEHAGSKVKEEYNEVEYLECYKCEPDENEVRDLSTRCQLCHRAYNTISGLKAHVLTSHTYSHMKRKQTHKRNKHVCRICRRVFSTQTDLLVHSSCHSALCCYSCGTTCSTLTELFQHRDHCRSSDTPCTDGRILPADEENPSHPKRPSDIANTPLPLPLPLPPPSPPQYQSHTPDTPRPLYTCPLCPTHFTDSFHVKGHMEDHHQDRVQDVIQSGGVASITSEGLETILDG